MKTDSGSRLRQQLLVLAIIILAILWYNQPKPDTPGLVEPPKIYYEWGFDSISAWSSPIISDTIRFRLYYKAPSDSIVVRIYH